MGTFTAPFSPAESRSVMTGPFKYSAHLGYLFTEMPFRERIGAARQHGFPAMEHPAPYDNASATELAAWLAEAGLVYTQFGLYAGDAKRGEKGLGIFAERRDEFRDSVTAGLDYAQTIGVRMVHAMAGVLPPGERSQAHWDCYIDNLTYAAQAANARGMTILVEAMSAAAVPNYYIDTPDLGAKAIAAAGQPNIRLLLDVFHTASAGLDIFEQIERHAPLLGHVHIADYPGRHEPGTGTLDFDAIRAALQAVGYRGWLGCEYIPAGPTEDGLGWYRDILAPAS